MAMKKNEKMPTGATVKAVKNALAKKAAAKPSAMGQSAKSHQASLAKISGTVAAKNKMKEIKKSGQRLGVLDATGSAMSRATKKTAASFKKSK